MVRRSSLSIFMALLVLFSITIIPQQVFTEDKPLQIRYFNLVSTKNFPGKIDEFQNITFPPGVKFKKLMIVYGFLMGIQEFRSGREYTYYLIVYDLKAGRRLYNQTLDRSVTPITYNIVYSRKYSILVYSPDISSFTYLYDLDKKVPPIRKYSASGETILKSMAIDDYILVFTDKKIHIFYGDKYFYQSRLSSREVLNAYLYGGILFVFAYERATQGFKIYVETYSVYGVVFNPMYTLPIGVIRILNPYAVGLAGDGIILVNDRIMSIYKYSFTNFTIPISQVNLTNAYIVSSCAINDSVAIIYTRYGETWINIYDSNLQLTYSKELPLTISATTKVTSSYVDPSGRYVVFTLTSLSSRSTYTRYFIIVDMKYGVSGLYGFKETDTAKLEEFKYIHGGKLVLLKASIKSGKAMRTYLYISTIDFNYMKRYGPLSEMYDVSYYSRVSVIPTIISNKLRIFILSRISLAVVIGIPSLITYRDYSGDEFTYTIENTPYFFTLTSGAGSVQCVSRLGYTGPYELYPYAPIKIPDATLYVINSTEYSTHLIVKGESAQLVFQQVGGSGPGFILDHTGTISEYYIPPGDYLVKVVRGVVVGEVSISLSRNKTYVLDLNTINPGSNNAREGVLAPLLNFVEDNLENLLVLLIVLLIGIFISSLILAYRERIRE